MRPGRLMIWGKLFFTVGAISFAGSLPPGVLNVSVLRLAGTGGIQEAMWFAAGAVLAETGSVIAALFTSGLPERFRFLYKWFSMLALLMVLGLSVQYFYAAWAPLNPILYEVGNTGAPFRTGLLLSLLNPMHLTFWLGWAALMRREVSFPAGRGTNFFFLLGACTGSMLGFWVFAQMGIHGFAYLQKYHFWINILIGSSLLLVCAKQLYNSVQEWSFLRPERP